MDAARQVLRFSIPGTIFVLLSIAFIAFGRLFQGDSLDHFSKAIDANVAALATIFASIPLGFLAYQFYYLSFQPFVGLNAKWAKRWPRLTRRWPRVDRGARVLSAFSVDEQQAISLFFGLEAASEAEQKDLPREERPAAAAGKLEAELTGTVPTEGLLEFFGVQRLSEPFLEQFHIDLDHPYSDSERFKRAVDAYEKRWYDNWDVLRAFVAQMSQLSGGDLVLDEYTTLSDFYHALGACRTACTASFVLASSVLVTCLLDGHAALRNAIPAFFASGAIASLLWLVLNQTRRQTWKSAEMTLKYGLRFVLDRNSDFLESHPLPPSLT